MITPAIHKISLLIALRCRGALRGRGALKVLALCWVRAASGSFSVGVSGVRVRQTHFLLHPLSNPFRDVVNWKKGKDPHPQDKIQHLDFTKDPRPLYYTTPPCVVYYQENVRSKAVFGP